MKTIDLAIKSQPEYSYFLKEIKNKVRIAQIKASVRVNGEMLRLYWDIGEMIVAEQAKSNWGDSFIKQLSKDLTQEFQDLKGFSEVNLAYIKRWYLFYNLQTKILPQVVAKLETSNSPQVVAEIESPISQHIVTEIIQVPWGHNREIITKCKDIKEALFYIRETIANGWSRSVLLNQIASNLYLRKGSAVHNFSATLPAPQSDLAMQILKDPYCFDFINMTGRRNEREFENALVENITNFLIELGSGFAYVGKQYKLEVAGQEYYLDLLFYHLKLRCYVVVELKSVAFEPELIGKLNFYLSAADDILRHPTDNPTIGILICKSKNKVIVEYSLRKIQCPIGVSEYEFSKVVPDEFQYSLPSIEEIEAELDKT